MVQIGEVKGNARDNRTFAHTHIKGLGLRPDGTAERQAAGFVGQVAAREVIQTTFTSKELTGVLI
jgi:RuvB-like protein 1